MCAFQGGTILTSRLLHPPAGFKPGIYSMRSSTSTKLPYKRSSFGKRCQSNDITELVLLKRGERLACVLMGDKSPKSKQKNQNQKQSNQDASAKEKQRLIDSKKIGAITALKKK
jgi:hypothetical protein